MNELPITIEQILAEDKLRQKKLHEKVDPISGKGSIGKRFRFKCKMSCTNGIPEIPAIQYLPRTLLKHPLITKLTAIGIATPEQTDEFDRLRCCHDFPYWAARYAFIKPKGGGENVNFMLNAPQRKMVEMFENFRTNGQPIRIILLKARQWGGSTCTQIYIAWLQLTQQKSLNSLIIAHQNSASEEIKDMFTRMIDNYPMRMLLQPEEIQQNGIPEKEKKLVNIGRSGASIRLVRRDCKIKIGSAERPDSSRGGDYNLLHLSEVGIWKKTEGKSPEDIVRSATSGVLHAPNTMIVYESTANGTGNFFHREYESAKRGESQMRPLFVAWYEIMNYSLPPDSPHTLAEQLLAFRLQDQAPSERCAEGKYLWKLWEKGATLAAINWYIKERAKYNDHSQMASEYPSDDIEAFAHSGARVFDRYLVEKLRKDCISAKWVGDIEGCGNSRTEALKGLHFVDDKCSCLEIWEMPGKENISHRYLVAVDIGGRSSKADWSVIAVIDRAEMCRGGKPRIAAQWRGHCDMDILAWRAAKIAAFYRNALLVIESNTLETHDLERNTEGDQSYYILNQIRDAYPNLYTRTANEDAIIRGAPVKYGFHTNSSTKPMIISTLIRVIRDNLYIERDQRCLDEYLCYERRQNGSYGAITGCHDDLLMTRAIGLHICFHEMPMPKYNGTQQHHISHKSRQLISEAMF